ncbi:retrovirus-related pol polyprotein from transposon TNT 1-94 [Tanacetum coccineum]
MSNSNTNLQTQSSNALHNAIMEAGSKDRPPMLAPGNYVQWKSRIKRYIDTKPNSELIHYCLQNPPYTYQWTEKTVPVAEGSSETTTERYMENYKNVSQDIRDQLNAERLLPDSVDNSRPIFDDEPMHKVQNNNDNYNVFAMENEHPEQPESKSDEPDDTDDLDQERDLLASLIQKLKCEIDDSKNRNKILESSNKALVDKLKGVIPTTSVSRPQLKSNQLENRVMPNNSQGKKQNVEDHHRHFKFSNNRTSITACNDSLNAKNHRMTRQPMAVPISTREPKHNVNQSIATSSKKSKKTVATDSTVKKSRNITRKLYEQLVEIILFIVDFGCSKHMTRTLKLLTNYVEKFLGTVKFGNDQIAPILGYGDLVQDLEVAFQKSTCYIRDLKGNDLLTGSRGTDLYSISLQDSTTPNPICLMDKATSSQAWLWHRLLYHLNFDTINLLSNNNIVNGLPKLKFFKDHLRLQLQHMDLCGPMRVESINGKKYILVIVDDYSRYTWTHFLRSKDETPGVLIDFLTLVNKTLHAYFAKEGIRHKTSTARTPEQNSVVERQNRTLVEAARTILSAAKVPLVF